MSISNVSNIGNAHRPNSVDKGGQLFAQAMVGTPLLAPRTADLSPPRSTAEIQASTAKAREAEAAKASGTFPTAAGSKAPATFPSASGGEAAATQIRSASDLVMIKKDGGRIPSAEESVRSLAQQFSDGPQLKAGDPNAPRHEQRYASPAQKAVLGALHEVASGPAALTTLVGMGAEKIGLGDGLRKAGEAWQGKIDGFYGGGPEQGHADVTNSVEWETGKMGARIVDFAAGVVTGVGATSGPRAATNAAGRPARSLNPAPDIATRTPPRAAAPSAPNAPATAARTLPPGHSFNGPDLNMRAPAPGVPNATPRVPPSATPSGAANAASNVPVNPPAASGALRAPEIGNNSAIRNAARDAAADMGVNAPDLRPRPRAEGSPVPVKQVAEQRVANFVDYANIPPNVKDDVAAAVQKEATRRAGNATPEVAAQRIDQYIGELQTQPQQLNLISTRAERARGVAVDASVSKFVRSQEWTNPERVKVATELRSQLKDFSVLEATERLDKISRRPADMRALVAQADVSMPKNPNPLDQVNLLNGRTPVEAPTVPSSNPTLSDRLVETDVFARLAIKDPLKAPKALFDNLDPVGDLARLGKAEMEVINAPKEFLVQGSKDLYNTVVPPGVRNFAAGGVNNLEKFGDIGVKVGNALTGIVHKGSSLLPEAITQPATNLMTGVAKAGGAISNAINSTEMRAAQTLAGNAMALGVVSQAGTLEPYSGVVGAGDPHVDNIAGMAFIPKGSSVVGLRSTEDTVAFVDLSASFYQGWHQALGAPGRFTVSAEGPGLLGTQLWRAFANANSVIVAPKDVDPNIFRAQATMSSSLLGGARNPTVKGTAALPYQVGSGANVGSQFSFTAFAPSTTTYGGIVFGPVFPILRGPDAHYLNTLKLQEGAKHAIPIKNATSALAGNAAYGVEKTDESVQNLRLWLDSLSPVLTQGHDSLADLLLPTYGEKLERMEKLPLNEEGTKVEQRP